MFHCTFCKTVWVIEVHLARIFITWARDCRSSSSKAVVGNGGLDSNLVVSTCLVLSWKVIYGGDGGYQAW